MATLYRVTSAESREFGLNSGHAIGVDVGGTKIAAGVIGPDGSIVRSVRAATPAGDGFATQQRIVELVRELSEESLPIGVAVAGFINADQSVVSYAPNIDWREVPLRDNLEQRLGAAVTVENDANAAGWAEFRFGAGRGIRHMTLLTIGTGVGGAIVMDGTLVRGGFGAAGELGHLRIVPDGIECGCGQRGCLEQYGSGRALLRRLNELADTAPDGAVLASVRDRDGSLSADNVGPLIRSGDPGAARALDELGSALGQACASLTAVLEPERYVFGGGLAVAGSALLAPIRSAFTEAQPARGFRPVPEFVVAELGSDAGMVGAADLAQIYLQSQSTGK